MTFVDLEDVPESSKQDTNKKESTPVDRNTGQWGYDLYPERRQEKKPTPLTHYILGKGSENLEKIKCERGVYRCFKESPIVKLMLGALKSSGCPVDIRRHISCEECSLEVSGGFDPVLNQVVICHNNASKEGIIQGVLLHEMVHMFDFCRNNLDFKNIDHLACTEIRAANLAHCSFMSAWVNGDTSIFNMKATHQNCVKNKALTSMLAVRNITQNEAINAIERVFDRCYNDLEPLGRRLRRSSNDMTKAYEDGIYYGYVDS
ncbi:mitochondrial inner membrane protease ATP23 homolog [Sitophilus oryzae]|uniref:Mitochondrial inner membrane protease ATP23 n=1 Tax=Sitophilus oryzae TaxID=7048 RepID=A0A6J2YCH9_SITOR|nr:mitochondrial inner membrane protease ATP23 homolog [Sitophilus oryzae]